MSDSVYRKTNLPARLNLNNRNTGEQLKAAPGPENTRGVLESASAAAQDSQLDCNDVMRKDLQDWLKAHGIDGPPPSPEAEQRAMWAWIRDFHKEYTEDWFTRNMPRLRDQFRPIFNQVIKQMKQAMKPATPAATSSVAAVDLLDMGACSVGPSVEAQPGNAAVGGDLLSFDSSSSSAQPTVPPATAQVVDLAVGGDLLSLDSSSASAHPTVPPATVDLASGADLLSLGSLESPTQPAVPPPTPAFAGSAPVGDLLSLGSFDPVCNEAAKRSDDPLAGLLL